MSDHVFDPADLRALLPLARRLAEGDSEVEDLLQDTAVIALHNPPSEGGPTKQWLSVVLRNRFLMGRRAKARQHARESQVALTPQAATPPDVLLQRARLYQKMSTALVELAEPFRSVVIRRYVDGQTAAAIAKELKLPAGTVRWQLQEGLKRLRAALDEESSRSDWQAMLLPLAESPYASKVAGSHLTGVLFMKAQSKVIVTVVGLLLLLGGGSALVWQLQRDNKDSTSHDATLAKDRVPTASFGIAVKPPSNKTLDPLGLASERAVVGTRPTVKESEFANGLVTGRVINWSTGEPVPDAELAFTGAGTSVATRTDSQGAFALNPPESGTYRLLTLTKPGFLPYAPEWQHSSIVVTVRPKLRVSGVIVFLFPAVPYLGMVVQPDGKPVAGATVRMLGTPTGEQALEPIKTEFKTDAKGQFEFNAQDLTVFEAEHGGLRGRAMLDGDAQLTHSMTITLGSAPKVARTISGTVVDEKGVALDDVLVRALPLPQAGAEELRAVSFATSDGEGIFTLNDVDGGNYLLVAEHEDGAPTEIPNVVGGQKDVQIVLDAGKPIRGTTVDNTGEPVSAYTLLVWRRDGAKRELVSTLSVIDPEGRFEVRMKDGAYDLSATASGWAPSDLVSAEAGASDVALKVRAGATIRGNVTSADDHGPLQYVRVMREGQGGGASAQPANAGTVSNEQGWFELTGVPPGPVTLAFAAGGHHPKLESSITASEGAVIGPLNIELRGLKAGEKPTLELVGIGCKLKAEQTGILVEAVIPGGGAEAAGMLPGDVIVAIEGVSVDELGLDGAIGKIRGAAGTMVRIRLRREKNERDLNIERRVIKT